LIQQTQQKTQELPSPADRQDESHYVKVEQLALTGQAGVPEEDLKAIITFAARLPYYRTRWKDELRDIRREWQHRGYFRVTLDDGKFAEPAVAGTDKGVSASFVITAGLLYRLKAIEFRINSQFSSSELRALFPMHDGDVFDAVCSERALPSWAALTEGEGSLNSRVFRCSKLTTRRRTSK